MKYRNYRWPCRYDVRIVSAAGRLNAKIINISDVGARVEGCIGIPSGETVTILFLNNRISAQLVWARDGLAGLRFVQRLGESAVETIRNTGAPRWGHFAHAV